jgi:hypothetical protein
MSSSANDQTPGFGEPSKSFEDATPDESAGLLAPMPPPARQEWASQGAATYASYIGQVRGEAVAG